MDHLLNQMVLLAQIGVPILAVVGISCLIRCRGKNHKRLVWTAAVFLSALALMFGGEILLGFWDLTWRTLPMVVFCWTLLVSGWVGIVLTVGCLMPLEMPSLAPVLRRTLKGVALFFAGVVLFVTIWLGPLVIGFGFDNTERVVERQGQTLLEVDDGFMDPHYSYYEYHGPLVRGSEQIYDDYEPLH